MKPSSQPTSRHQSIPIPISTWSHIIRSVCSSSGACGCHQLYAMPIHLKLDTHNTHTFDMQYTHIRHAHTQSTQRGGRQGWAGKPAARRITCCVTWIDAESGQRHTAGKTDNMFRHIDGRPFNKKDALGQDDGVLIPEPIQKVRPQNHVFPPQYLLCCLHLYVCA